MQNEETYLAIYVRVPTPADLIYFSFTLFFHSLNT